MAVTYFPFNSIVVDGVPDRPANAENLAAYLAGFFSNGVLMQEDTALKVEASEEMLVQIHAGMGIINGKSIRNDSAHILALDNANASLDRIDRIIIRLDETARYMMFDVLKGTPASSPTAPALTQGADVYELCLAEIRVPAGASTILASYITDTRADADLCGVASIPEHAHDAANIISGLLSADRLPVVPISKGGHGKTTAAAGLLALGGVSKKLLYSNGSLNSQFGSQTLKNIKWSDYNKIGLEYQYSDENTDSTYEEVTAKDGARILMKDTNLSTSRVPQFAERTMILNSSGIAFTQSYIGLASGNAQVSNWYCLPVRIWGIKGVQ